MSAAAEGVRAHGAAPLAAPREGPAPALAPDAAERSRLALRTVFAAVVLGIMGDTLFRVEEWGLNFTLWTLTLAHALVYLRTRRGTLSMQERWLLVPVLFFAATFAWRGEDLGFFNFLALTLALTLLARSSLGGAPWDVTRAGFDQYIGSYIVASASVVGGSALLFLVDRPFAEARAMRGSSRAGALARGAAISLPLVFVFGSLFASADPAYERMLTGLIDFDFGETLGHIVVAGAVAWVAAGCLRYAVLAGVPQPFPVELPRLTLGRVELATVLGSVNAVFLSFVALQLRHMFGGAELVARTAGMTFAEYARHGFFELVVVSALVLPLLLLTRAALAGEPRAERLYGRLASVLLVLLAVVMASAIFRMRLYQDAYGLTLDRVVATAIMTWLAVVFVWFASTVLRGRPARLAFGALTSAWVILAALNAANPAALVTRVNLARAAEGKAMDVGYALSLGGDAAPTLVEGLGTLSPPDRCVAAKGLLKRWVVDRPPADWRSASLESWRAARAVRAGFADLVEASKGPCPPARASR